MSFPSYCNLTLFFFKSDYGIRRSVTLGLHTFFFFFQAEDGIRDADVTGVQTCALPISARQEPGLHAADAAGRQRRAERAEPHEGGEAAAGGSRLGRQEPQAARRALGDRKSVV